MNFNIKMYKISKITEINKTNVMNYFHCLLQSLYRMFHHKNYNLTLTTFLTYFEQNFISGLVSCYF